MIIPIWFIITSLFFPRISLIVALLFNQILGFHFNIVIWIIGFFVWVLFPRSVNIALLIKGLTIKSFWVWLHITILITVYCIQVIGNTYLNKLINNK